MLGLGCPHGCESMVDLNSWVCNKANDDPAVRIRGRRELESGVLVKAAGEVAPRMDDRSDRVIRFVQEVGKARTSRLGMPA